MGVYSSHPTYRKDPSFYSAFSLTVPSTFAEMDPKEHAIIRSMIAPFFSRKSVLGLENVIQERVDALIHQLVHNHQKLPADMDLAFRSATLDIITLYTFGISIDAVSYHNFQHPVVLDSARHTRNKWFFKHFPRVKKLTVSLPPWFASLIGKGSSFSFVQEITKLVDDTLRNPDAPSLQMSHNIYYSLLNNETRPEKEEKRLNRRWLIGEGLNLRGAGSDTVGNTCTIGVRYVLGDRRVLNKLQLELDTMWPDRDDRVPLERLEKLPYLVGRILHYRRVKLADRVVG
ncbi:hypothetical protein V5O48_011588 [Marasmius crinis-equi]|uniref:Cytochrome P450 n=1 Tax=Marasmius crinis-equi TaxID=585013 RepID=A0ABR3F560_9AGAR